MSQLHKTLYIRKTQALQIINQGDALSISCDEVNNKLRYLLDDNEYQGKYKDYLNQTVDSLFESSKMIDKYQYYHNLIYDFVVGIEGEQKNYCF